MDQLHKCQRTFVRLQMESRRLRRRIASSHGYYFNSIKSYILPEESGVGQEGSASLVSSFAPSRNFIRQNSPPPPLHFQIFLLSGWPSEDDNFAENAAQGTKAWPRIVLFVIMEFFFILGLLLWNISV